MKKSRKLKPLVKVIILVLIAFILFLITGNKKLYIKNKDKIILDYSNYITASSEYNKDIVGEYFLNGMKINEFKDLFNYSYESVNLKGNYEKIKYDFSKVLKYEEIEEYIRLLSRSSLVNVNVIGSSEDGRSIYEVILGSGKDVTIIEAGTHSAEVANPLYSLQFMIDLVNNFEDKNEDVVNFFKGKKIIVLPMTNPDGNEFANFGKETIRNKSSYIYTNIGDDELLYYKGNINGVDINRNFPTQNAGLVYKTSEIDSSVSLVPSIEDFYGGSYLGSESETRAIMRVIYKYKDSLVNYISLHSMGRIIFNGKPHLSDEFNNYVNQCSEEFSSISGYTSMSSFDEETGSGNDGTSSEFAAELSHGFVFSSETLRLSSVSYGKANAGFKKVCVIVAETMNWYRFDIDSIRDEYYKYRLYDSMIRVIN